MWHAWERKVYKVLMGKPEGKRLLGRPVRRWEDGIRTDLREIGGGGVELIHLAQDSDRWRAVVNTVMNLAPRSLFLVSSYVTSSTAVYMHGLPFKTHPKSRTKIQK
jgi:hypothetical protein